MKITAKKVTVSGFSLLAVMALAGSLSGTVAWFQFSTRATVAYTGAAAHATENLQISIDGQHWNGDLTTKDIRDYLQSTGRVDTALRPVTTGVQGKDDALKTLYKNPSREHVRMGEWGEANKDVDYVTLPLQLRALDVDGRSVETFLDKDIYLSDLTIQEKPVEGNFPIIDAVRVHLNAGENNYLFSLKGESVTTHGYLDLNGDGELDLSSGYSFDGPRAYADYGIAGSYDSVEELPLVQVGDFYKVTTSAKLVWDSQNNEWVPDPETATVRYYLFNGKGWVISEAEPEGEHKGDLTKAEDLPEFALINDVYEVGEKFYRAVELPDEEHHRYVLGYQEYDACASSSYSIENKDYIADDTDPYNIVGTPIAKTYSSVQSDEELLLDKDYYYVTLEERYYAFLDNAWVIQASRPIEGRNRGSVDILSALPEVPNADSIHYVRADGVTKKWDAASKSWVPNADFTVNALNAETSVKGKDYFLLADNEGYAKGIYTFDGVAFSRKADSLTINVTIYLEGWQELRPTDSVATTEALMEKVATKIGTVYVAGGQYKTWTGAKLEAGQLKLENGAWVEGSTEEPVEVQAFPDTSSWVKMGQSYYIEDVQRTLRWTGTEWLEGASSIWDVGSYVGSMFNIGLRFSAEPHDEHH